MRMIKNVKSMSNKWGLSLEYISMLFLCEKHIQKSFLSDKRFINTEYVCDTMIIQILSQHSRVPAVAQ